jgi:lipopolysaccharide export system permease protein
VCKAGVSHEVDINIWSFEWPAQTKRGGQVKIKKPLIMDKYIISEYLGPFIACVAGFTVILLSGALFELADLIFTNKMSIDVVLRLLLYKIPLVVVVTLPIAVLFATLLSLGRLARDNELAAIRSAGVSFKRISVPILFMGLLTSGFTLLLNEKIVPEANHQAENLYRISIFRDSMPPIRSNVFFQGTGGRYFYVEEVNPRNNKLENVLIYETDKSNFPGIITAKWGTFSEGEWQLHDGVMRKFDDDGFIENEVHFDMVAYPIPEDDAKLFGTQKTIDEMTRAELKRHIDLFKRSGIDMASLLVQYHGKLAKPFASFIWVLVGAPLALRARRGGRFFGVAAAIFITFLYYVAEAIFHSLGGNLLFTPLFAAWAANIFFALFGLYLILRADRV